MEVLVVTGSSRGIGAEICRAAAAKDWAVCVNYATSTDEAELVVKDIEQAGGRAISVSADVSIDSEVAALFERVDAELGPITGLVNNAGINGGGTRVDELDVDQARRIFEVNILGSFLCAKHAIRRMAKRYGGVGGSIVNISSAASKHGGPGTYIDYAASKGCHRHLYRRTGQGAGTGRDSGQLFAPRRHHDRTQCRVGPTESRVAERGNGAGPARATR